MPRMLTVKLTVPEIDHLIGTMSDERERGDYYGNCEQFWNRHERIVLKLREAVKTLRSSHDT